MKMASPTHFTEFKVKQIPGSQHGYPEHAESKYKAKAYKRSPSSLFFLTAHKKI